MTKKIRATCENCQHWQRDLPDLRVNEQGEEYHEPNIIGECRHRSPSADFRKDSWARWPRTHQSKWCSAFRMRLNCLRP